MNKKINKLKLAILIKKIRKGDPEAFGKIYDQYVKKIYRYIFFKVPGPEIAEDLTQEVFINLLEYLKNTKHPIDELQGFIYKIAKNVVAQYYRTAHKDKNLSLIENIENENQELFNAAAFQISARELENIIDKKIDVKLVAESIEKINNKNYQEIIILRFVQDLSLKEISKLINKNVSATSVTLYRAINKLKEILKELKDNY